MVVKESEEGLRVNSKKSEFMVVSRRDIQMADLHMRHQNKSGTEI